MAWAWWIVCGSSFDQSAPIFYGEKFSWKYKGKDISKEPIRPIEQEVQQNQTKQEVRISVQAATFNVLSLNRRQPGEESVEVCRPALLRQQLESAGYHMVGLQETRTNCSTTFVAADYVRYVSGCIEDSGLYGCEIWLSRRLPFGSVGADKIWLDHRKVTVLFSDPRMLALRAQLRGCSLLVISGHAPHEGDDAQTKDYWWQRLHGVLSKHSRLGRVIILGDFNARLGRQVGQITGALQDVQTNDNGERLLEFCEEYLLRVPSTFEHLHSGQQHTWVHPKGNKARIDYILFDEQFRNCVAWSSCDINIQVGNSAIDHTLLGIGLQWIEESLCQKRVDHRMYDWEAMHTPEGKEKVREMVRQLPDVAWTVDPHLHWQILEDKLHEGLQMHFPPRKRQPRADLFTHNTWKALGRRKIFKQALVEWDHIWEHHVCESGFRAWKDGMLLGDVERMRQLDGFALLLSRYMLLVNFRSMSRLVRTCSADDKAAYISRIGTEAAAQNNTDIFATLRKLSVGSGFRKKSLAPLPLLKSDDGVVLQSWESRDDRWREHCASMEAGILTTTDSLLNSSRKTSFKRLQIHPDHDVTSIPSLRDLEGAFRRIRPRKTPGVDNIRSDLCSLAASDLAWKYHSLLTKMVTTYSEPMQMKGGVLVSAWKSGSMGDVDSYRSLLLSSHVGKALRRTLRPRMVELYTTVAPSLHVSVKAGGNVTHASHALRGYLNASQKLKRSTAILYLDIKSAYYRVIRQLASNLTTCDADIARVMQHFELEPEEMHHLLHEIKQKSALQHAGADVHDELLIEELLQHTWFTTCTKRTMTESLAGTPPGDGMADVVFSFVFQRLLSKVHEDLQDLLSWAGPINMPEVGITVPANTTMDLPPMIEVVWADDLAFALSAPTAQEATSQIAIVARHLFQKCLQHGMRPNMARNKTEVMLFLRGAGSRHLKRELFNSDAPALFVEEVPETYSHLRITGSYKHLGHRLQLGDDIFGELKARTGQAHSVFRKYRRQVFQNRRLPLNKRKYLFQTLVLSILRYGMGSWPRLTGKSWLYFQSRIMALYRGLLRPTIPDPELRMWNNDRILAYLDLPSPSTLLHDSRLRYSLSLLRHGPQQLWYILLAEHEWLELLSESIAWMQEQLIGYGPDRYGHPFTPDWDKWFREQPQAVKGWISKAVRHATLQSCIRTQWFEWHHTFLLECQRSGLNINFPWTTLVQPEPARAGDLDACLQCRMIFRGRGPWSVHAFKKHGRINWRRHFISTGRCEACMKDFHTPTRLLHHLNYSSECALTLRRNRIRTEVQPGRNSKREVRDGALKIPAIRSEGPIRAWENWDGIQDDPDIDDALMDDLVDCMLAIREDTPVEEGVLLFKNALAASDNAFSTIRYTFGCLVSDQISELEGVHADRQRMVMLMVKDLLRLRWFFNEEDIEQAGPLPMADDLRGNAWKYCSVDRSRKCWTNTRHDPRNHFKDFAIVHLFAGERREGDLESFLENITVPAGAVKVVLSVDIIYDPRNADLSEEGVQQRWIGFINKGLVAVLVTGPPCETWSSSRALGGVAGHAHGDGGPRMLRTAEWMQGLPGLRLREARQVLMANILLTFSIMAVLCMLRAQRVSLLEHPSEPQEAWMPSIWKLHVIDLLVGHDRAQLHHLQQGRYGGHSPKPTTLLVTAPDHTAIRESLQRFAITELPKALSMGREAGGRGEYSTAKLKSYPPLLCRAMADIAEKWGRDCFFVQSDHHSDQDFLDYVARLRCGFNLAAQRGQDYACN